MSNTRITQLSEVDRELLSSIYSWPELTRDYCKSSSEFHKGTKKNYTTETRKKRSTFISERNKQWWNNLSEDQYRVVCLKIGKARKQMESDKKSKIYEKISKTKADKPLEEKERLSKKISDSHKGIHYKHKTEMSDTHKANIGIARHRHWESLSPEEKERRLANLKSFAREKRGVWKNGKLKWVSQTEYDIYIRQGYFKTKKESLSQ